MKKSCLALAMALALVLPAGCAAKNSSAVYTTADTVFSRSYGPENYAAYDGTFEEAYWDVDEAAEEAPLPVPASGTTGLSSVTAADRQGDSLPEPQKLIYTADLDMETLDFDGASAALTELTAELGGYFQSSALNNAGVCRWASFNVRIPAENYRTFLEQAGEQCHVLSLREYTEDVSESYYDTAGRLETQRTKLVRLQALLEEAEDMEDIIVLEDAISGTEELIDRLSGTLRHYDALVEYSTVNISLEEVLQYEPEPAPTFGSRLGAAFSSGLKSFAGGVENILVGLAYGWLWVVLIAAVAALILWLTRKHRAERRKEREELKARRLARENTSVTYSAPGEGSSGDRPEE